MLVFDFSTTMGGVNRTGVNQVRDAAMSLITNESLQEHRESVRIASIMFNSRIKKIGWQSLRNANFTAMNRFDVKTGSDFAGAMDSAKMTWRELYDDQEWQGFQKNSDAMKLTLFFSDFVANDAELKRVRENASTQRFFQHQPGVNWNTLAIHINPGDNQRPPANRQKTLMENVSGHTKFLSLTTRLWDQLFVVLARSITTSFTDPNSQIVETLVRWQENVVATNHIID